MARAVRLPVALLAIASAVLVAGGVAWANARHLSCDDSLGRDQGIVLMSRWGGLATASLSLVAALICAARARAGRPSLGFAAFCAYAVAAGLLACLVSRLPDALSGVFAPLGYDLAVATIAVYYVVPALLLLVLFLVAVRFVKSADDPRLRVLRSTQSLALWFAFVLAPGCAGVGLVSQFPICLG